jgi:UDP-N-acetylmuramyl pentapeptide phosphotransferase/UDP-N-acetylglucosamine-1-phosphate transferase
MFGQKWAIMISGAGNDGIDGLAATTGIIVNGTFAFLFIYNKAI